MADPEPRKMERSEADRGLRAELLSMREDDLAVRSELQREGVLFDAYHAGMEAVHLRNAAALAEVFERVGWPDAARVGADAVDAAWLVLMHSISRPDVLRRGRELLSDAVAGGRTEAWRLARIDDRIRTLEGRPQRYGTLLDWDDEGRLAPYPIEDPAEVDRRRAAVGLPPLEDEVDRIRREARRRGDRPPRDPVARRAAYERWLRRTGWR